MDQFAQFIPLLLIFAIMYFLLIRPQQKKVKEHKAMVDGLRRGDQVVTAGGLIGKVVKVKDDGELEVELADNVKVRVTSSTGEEEASVTGLESVRALCVERVSPLASIMCVQDDESGGSTLPSAYILLEGNA